MINIENNATKQQYIEMRICGIYIVLIYQPKAIFDYLIAV